MLGGRLTRIMPQELVSRAIKQPLGAFGEKALFLWWAGFQVFLTGQKNDTLPSRHLEKPLALSANEPTGNARGPDFSHRL
jgi:hypothetical protein